MDESTQRSLLISALVGLVLGFLTWMYAKPYFESMTQMIISVLGVGFFFFIVAYFLIREVD